MLQGHKRWDKAVTSGLENLRNLVHENFLPALERCAIILSRLRGVAQFYDTRDDIGFTATQINRVLDITSCLSLVGHKILIHVMDELEHFAAFSGWLRFQIERLGTSASSATDDLTEKEATMDASKVLTYTERYLTGSPLDGYFDEISKEDYTADWDHIEDGPSLLHVLDKQLKKAEEGQPSMKALPHVDFLVNYATMWTGRIFKDIADAKKRSVRFGKAMKLRIGGPITSMDVRMCEADKVKSISTDVFVVCGMLKSFNQDGGAVYTAVASKNAPSKGKLLRICFFLYQACTNILSVYVFRAELSIVNGISSNKSLNWLCLDLGDKNLIDLKFLNAAHLILLCSTSGNTNTLVPRNIQCIKKKANLHMFQIQINQPYTLFLSNQPHSTT